MANRKLDLEKFLDAIPVNLLTEYFKKKQQEEGIEIADISTKGIIHYLDSPGQKDIKDDIQHNFIEINDLCERSMSILVEEINKEQIQFSNDETREQLSMRVFLQHKGIFEYAHDLYYLTHSSGKLSEHNIKAEKLEITDDKKRLFEERVKNYFVKSAKGGNCIIRYHQKDDGLMIAIIRGSYKRAVSSWQDDGIKDTKTLIYRPANEDILEYNSSEQKLYIKGRTRKDREMYIIAFAEDIVGDKSQIDREDRDDTFDLSILQDPDFRFDLNEDVQAVYLLEVRIMMMGMRKPDLVFRSTDVLSSLKEEVRGLSLNIGTIQHAKFLFRLKIDRKIKKVTFEITPPNATDLNKKKYSRIISQYLERIGIKKNAQLPAQRMVEDTRALV